MTATLERTPARPEMRHGARPWPAAVGVTAGAAAIALGAWAFARTLSSEDNTTLEATRDGLILLWAIVGLLMATSHARRRMGTVVAGATALAGVGSISGRAAPLAAALLPAVALYLSLAYPQDVLGTRGRRVLGFVAFGGALAVGLGLVAAGAGYPLWPVVLEVALFGVVGLVGMAERYSTADPTDRRRLMWFWWGLTVAAGVALVATGLHLLVSWPRQVAGVAVAGTTLIPVAVAAGLTPRFGRVIDGLLTATILLSGLAALVVAIYVGVVLGLGHVPSGDERTLLVLSIIAAAVAALLYVPARHRLSRLADRLVHGGRQTPEDVLRTFGSRMSRSIPLDELLLQLAESLRRALALSSAEVWTASGGSLELAVSDPERSDRPRVDLTSADQSTVTGAGVSGPAWIKVWMPSLLAGRETARVRVTPVAHSGELLGMLVVERPAEAEPLSIEEERILTELARQVALTLHNVRLDSALQASLDEVRRQAEALQASRGRIVAVADAERRRIERNLHDGAQQHLVALAVKLRLAQQLAERDPQKAQTLLTELGADLQDALQELRDLAHGIYPPLLVDRGLPDALASAARRATVPADVKADGIGRFPAELEAAVYFCCVEALQNASKHAGPDARVTVRLWEDAGGLLFEVADDGAGFDVRAKGVGTGFTNMSDRLGAIGGTLRVESASGQGTRVSGAIPVRP